MCIVTSKMQGLVKQLTHHKLSIIKYCVKAAVPVDLICAHMCYKWLKSLTCTGPTSKMDPESRLHMQPKIPETSVTKQNQTCSWDDFTQPHFEAAHANTLWQEPETHTVPHTLVHMHAPAHVMWWYELRHLRWFIWKSYHALFPTHTER